MNIKSTARKYTSCFNHLGSLYLDKLYQITFEKNLGIKNVLLKLFAHERRQGLKQGIKCYEVGNNKTTTSALCFKNTPSLPTVRSSSGPLNNNQSPIHTHTPQPPFPSFRFLSPKKPTTRTIAFDRDAKNPIPVS